MSSRRIAVVVTLAAAAALTGCGGPPAFECSGSDACDAIAGGVCEGDGRCSYPDAACESGRRYGDNSGGASGACVALGPNDVDGGDDPSDGGGDGDGPGGDVDRVRWSTGHGAHLCLVRERDERGFCLGENASGQLGSGSVVPDQSLEPLPVTGDHDLAATATGDVLTCAIDADGAALCWGNDAQGKLGNGPVTTTVQPAPTAVLGLPGPASSIACGSSHACAVAAAGTADPAVYCWGDNGSGQQGRVGADTDLATVPVQLAIGAAAEQVRTGFNHACAVIAGGDLWCWGANGSGQLSGVSGAGIVAPTKVASGIAEVATGDYHTCALVADGGAVRCWGIDSSGQQGDGADTSPAMTTVALPEDATAVIAGQKHTCALGASGAVYCWGLDAAGQVDGVAGVPITSPVVVDLAGPAISLGASEYATCAQLADGALVCWGTIADTIGPHMITLPP